MCIAYICIAYVYFYVCSVICAVWLLVGPPCAHIWTFGGIWYDRLLDDVSKSHVLIVLEYFVCRRIQIHACASCMYGWFGVKTRLVSLIRLYAMNRMNRTQTGAVRGHGEDTYREKERHMKPRAPHNHHCVYFDSPNSRTNTTRTTHPPIHRYRY